MTAAGCIAGLGKLIDAIVDSWDSDTTAPSAQSVGDNKPHGQCVVTTLVVQDYLGGSILRCDIPELGSHYWNLIPGVGELDLTREQYHSELPIPRGIEVSRRRVLEGDRAIAARTPERYELLASRVAIKVDAP